jgi:hypothetical protein
MYNQALKYASNLPVASRTGYIDRLNKLRSRSRYVGWGVEDELNSLWYAAELDEHESEWGGQAPSNIDSRPGFRSMREPLFGGSLRSTNPLNLCPGSDHSGDRGSLPSSGLMRILDLQQT